jgi:hypothetical protein
MRESSIYKVSKSGERKKGEHYGNPGAVGKGDVMSKKSAATCPYGEGGVKRVKDDL